MMYTTHGHPILGSEDSIAENPPEQIARCGGPALCSQCSLDQAAYLQGALTPKPKPMAPVNKPELPTIETHTFQRKPFEVEAVQVTDENFEAIAAWCGGSIVTVQETPRPGMPAAKRYIQVPVARPLSRRQTEAYVGDWVLYASKGFKVYADRPFRKNFDSSTEVLQELFVTDEAVSS